MKLDSLLGHIGRDFSVLMMIWALQGVWMLLCATRVEPSVSALFMTVSLPLHKSILTIFRGLWSQDPFLTNLTRGDQPSVQERRRRELAWLAAPMVWVGAALAGGMGVYQQSSVVLVSLAAVLMSVVDVFADVFALELATTNKYAVQNISNFVTTSVGLIVLASNLTISTLTFTIIQLFSAVFRLFTAFIIGKLTSTPCRLTTQDFAPPSNYLQSLISSLYSLSPLFSLQLALATAVSAGALAPRAAFVAGVVMQVGQTISSRLSALAPGLLAGVAEVASDAGLVLKQLVRAAAGEVGAGAEAVGAGVATRADKRRCFYFVTEPFLLVIVSTTLVGLVVMASLPEIIPLFVGRDWFSRSVWQVTQLTSVASLLHILVSALCSVVSSISPQIRQDVDQVLGGVGALAAVLGVYFVLNQQSGFISACATSFVLTVILMLSMLLVGARAGLINVGGVKKAFWPAILVLGALCWKEVDLYAIYGMESTLHRIIAAFTQKMFVAKFVYFVGVIAFIVISCARELNRISLIRND